MRTSPGPPVYTGGQSMQPSWESCVSAHWLVCVGVSMSVCLLASVRASVCLLAGEHWPVRECMCESECVCQPVWRHPRCVLKAVSVCEH